MHSVPDEIECPVCKTQIHDRSKNTEYDLMLELDAGSCRKQEEQRQQQNDDKTAVYISHTVSYIWICSHHQSSEEVEKVVLQSVISLEFITCRGAVAEYQICRNRNSGSSGGCKKAGHCKSYC